MSEEDKQETTEEVPESEPTSPARPSAIEEARAENDRREKLLKEENELQDRRESFEADRIVGGRAEAGGKTVKPKEENPHEYRMRVEKEMSQGKTEFGN